MPKVEWMRKSDPDIFPGILRIKYAPEIVKRHTKQPIMQLRFLIVDDEQLSRSYISDLVAEFMPGSAIHEAPSARSAIALIQEVKPDILFLDIKMPGTDGFELLGMMQNRDFELVFVTAHSQYAIQAIKEGACDYLTKPIKKTDFRETLKRASERRMKALALHEGKQNEDNYLEQKLVISFQQGMKIISYNDILYLKADNSYTTLFLVNNEKIITTKPINKFEKQLNSCWFFRIHKSYIVNTRHLHEYVAKGHNFAVMADGAKLIISRYRLSDFLQLIRKNKESQWP